MYESVLQRFSWREFRRSALSEHTDAATLARVHAYFFGAGSTLGLLSVVLFDSPDLDLLGAAICIACGYAVVAAMAIGFNRIPLVALQLVPALGTALISAGIYFAGESTSAYALMYVWVGLMGHLLGSRWTMLHVAIVGVGYGAVLLASDDPSMLKQWLVVIGTVGVAGLVVIALHDRLAVLIGRLGHAARTDPLTGLPNRRAFGEALDEELERTRRGSGTMCLAIADLDDFKHVNDELGHSEGDHALERVAATLDSGKRRIDTVARIGGEEFAVVLPHCDAEGARALADRLRTEVRGRFADEPCPLTISFGIAVATDGSRSKKALFEEADRALYRAKEQGGDRCAVERPQAAAAEG